MEQNYHSCSMSRIRYDERIAEHQGTTASGDAAPLSVFPEWFDKSFFDDEQLEYLASYEMERRGDIVRVLLDFLTSKRGAWVERAAVLDKIVNRPELQWREAPAAYGISNHRFFDAKRALEETFLVDAGRMLQVLIVRHDRRLTRKKKLQPQENTSASFAAAPPVDMAALNNDGVQKFLSL